MSRTYRLTTTLTFAALDDADACRLCGDLGQHVARVEAATNARAVVGSAKLQQVYDVRTPRLVRKWPSDNVSD